MQITERMKKLWRVRSRYPWRRAFGNILSFVIARVQDTKIQEVASSMTLTTLLSIVPLLAVSVAVFAAFPSFESARQTMESMIIESFLPPTYRDQILSSIHVLISQAAGLGYFGAVGLLVTSLLLIDKFFVTINQIFKVRRLRPWSQRALIYWAMLTLGPGVLVLSFTMTKQAWSIAMESGLRHVGPSGVWYFWGQVALQGLGYTLLYKYVPNTFVPFRNAAIGGLTAAFAGQVVKNGFEYYVTAGTLSTLYGAFVAFPVFLLWIYVAWFLVFSGAAITATIPLLTSGRYADSYKIGNDFYTGVALLCVLTRAKKEGKRSVPILELCDRVDSYPEAVERLLTRLSICGYCAQVVRNGRDDAWGLLCDPAKKNLLEAFHLLAADQTNTLVASKRRYIHRDEGMLFEWNRLLRDGRALRIPMASLFLRRTATKRSSCIQNTTENKNNLTIVKN